MQLPHLAQMLQPKPRRATKASIHELSAQFREGGAEVRGEFPEELCVLGDPSMLIPSSIQRFCNSSPCKSFDMKLS